MHTHMHMHTHTHTHTHTCKFENQGTFCSVNRSTKMCLTYIQHRQGHNDIPYNFYYSVIWLMYVKMNNKGIFEQTHIVETQYRVLDPANLMYLQLTETSEKSCIEESKRPAL